MVVMVQVEEKIDVQNSCGSTGGTSFTGRC